MAKNPTSCRYEVESVPWLGTPPNLIGLEDDVLRAVTFLEVAVFGFLPAVFNLPIAFCFSCYVNEELVKFREIS